jgi:hypothetical protein
LHEVRHLVNRDQASKCADKSQGCEAKSTDIEISAGLDNTLVCYFGDNHPSCSTNVAAFMFDITLGIVPALNFLLNKYVPVCYLCRHGDVYVT